MSHNNQILSVVARIELKLTALLRSLQKFDQFVVDAITPDMPRRRTHGNNLGRCSRNEDHDRSSA